MKIFDTRWNGAHGIGRFAAELFERLPGFMPIAIAGRPTSPADPLVLSMYLRTASPQLFFSPGYNAPLGSPCRFVFCVHDLAHLQVEEYATALKRAYYRYVVLPAMRTAAVVLTVSEFSRRSLCEWASIEESRVVNVSNGISAAFTLEGAVVSRARPYFLFVGRHSAAKNFLRTLKALRISQLADDFELVTTGEATPEVRNAVAELKLTDRVVFAGNHSDEKLAALYRGAAAMIFPSLYEGFGLPIVEAMACGTPVLCSSVTAMPEVAGDAALIVNPLDVEAIAAGMRRLAFETDLRAVLRARGLKRATAFSWATTATRASEALRSAT